MIPETIKNSNVRENHFEVQKKKKNKQTPKRVRDIRRTRVPMCLTHDLNSRYGEVEVQVEVQVCTKYSAYFETSKGNNDILRVQILGTHVRA